ncbi:MAG TPA: xanthine dehydrogenase family protein subunit M [Thermoleophilia bacterium]|nr:xanthine dehydrogenase family protein subunit M [Thermoleophilia bacterium]
MTVNTRVLIDDFAYHVPSTLDDALGFLDQYGEDAEVLAGGTDLIIQMKLGRRSPKFVVDISKLEELKHLEAGETILIGAGRRYMDVLPYLQGLGRYHGLAEAIDSIGKLQVLSVATVGGNLGNGSPAADTPPPLITYDASVRVRSAHMERVIPLCEFHTGPGATVLAPNEIIVAVEFDAFPDGRASAFRKLTRVASDISKVTCAVAVERVGETCTHCRIALGAVGPTPLRARSAEAALEGRTVDASAVDECARLVVEDISPIDDIRCSEMYRREAAGVLFKDAFASAWERATC